MDTRRQLAVGTEYPTFSRVWYTLDAGCVTDEVYYPTIDTPQIRDLQFLFTDGETFFHDERRNFTSEIAILNERRAQSHWIVVKGAITVIMEKRQ
jgi:glucodextranase-like protein